MGLNLQLSQFSWDTLLVIFGIGAATLLALGGFVSEVANMLKKASPIIVVLCLFIMFGAMILMLTKWLATQFNGIPLIATNPTANNVVGVMLLMFILASFIWFMKLVKHLQLETPKETEKDALIESINQLVNEMRENRKETNKEPKSEPRKEK